MKDLVEKIVEYTKTWSIGETEWYWNVECSRKSECYTNGKCEEHITWEEFERAIREEILYDLVYKNGISLKNQIENDLCNYENNNLIKDISELEQEIQKFITNFKIEEMI